MRSFTVTKQLPLSLIYIVDNRLSMVNYEFSFNIFTEAATASDESITTAQLNQNINFSKVVMFADAILNQSIVFDVNAADLALDAFSQLENNLLVLPSVSEEVFLAALHSKLNSIVSEDTYIDVLTLYNTSTKITYRYALYDEEHYYELPSSNEWTTELSYWPAPWWKRPDTNTMDRIASNQEEYNEWQQLRTEHSLDELYLSPLVEVEQQFSNDDKHGEVIDIDFTAEHHKKWSPVIVK